MPIKGPSFVTLDGRRIAYDEVHPPLALRHAESVEKLVGIAATSGGEAHVPAGPKILILLGQLDRRLEIGERMRQTYAALVH